MTETPFSQRLRQPIPHDLGAAAEGEARCRALLLGGDKRLMGHLEEMDTTEHLDEADAVERPFLNRKV
jgi:hypothetical protein